MSEKDFETIKEIGKGSYGSAFLARERSSGNYVVLKKIKLKNPIAKTSAEDEAKFLKNLSHPNVIQFIDSFRTDKEFCIVLEYADAKDLSHYLEFNKPSEKRILQIFSQIIFGLNYIHSQNILHRDIKITNIFLFKNGFVKIGDFGISREINGYDLARTIIGTPYFMAPEIIAGKPYGFPADVWSAGCILFELMTGKHAFTGKSRDELFANIQFRKLPRDSFSCFSNDLSDLLLKMLNKNPILRPTCSQILKLPIIRNALTRFQQKVSARYAPPHRSPRLSSKENLINFDLTEIDQTEIPEWIKDVPIVASELMRQSFRRVKDDINRFAEIIKSSLNNMKENINDNIGKVECDLEARKKKLETECKELLGEEKYNLAYEFIKENWTEKREMISDVLKIDYYPEREIKMIEAITMIERFQQC
ncbi:CAMK family protein kinase [Histomonas meleagridis]|uniref:CAMK family protein kinase n=1 Tax=Histomonas meleagridis TaxID=135588 RepID=UPI00355A1411|nr:CAMK family protein kinase [Histomonas meleagridis]KAH0802354.1 CAMK family protein kinase [Histomonas meleagridis]